MGPRSGKDASYNRTVARNLEADVAGVTIRSRALTPMIAKNA